MGKVFCFFFSKKKRFLFLPRENDNPATRSGEVSDEPLIGERSGLHPHAGGGIAERTEHAIEKRTAGRHGGEPGR
jgi:hypothetical protein